MIEKPVPYVSEAVADDLLAHVEENIERYCTGDFRDLADSGGWELHLSAQMDPEPLGKLDPARTPQAEINNSLHVWQALPSLTPALAAQNRVWTRLSHVECLDYARRRWLEHARNGTEVKAIRTHFFANTLTRYRDDNAISRLWWNAHIAHEIWPENPENALGLLLKSADIRQALVERPWITSRRPVARGIFRLMEARPSVMREENFRELMITINRLGAGIAFEVLSDGQIDKFLEHSCDLAMVNEPN